MDTNCDPDLVTYPIAGNDDAIRSVRMILATIGQTITQAQAEFESKRSRRAAEEAAAEAPVASVAPVEVAPQAPALIAAWGCVRRNSGCPQLSTLS